MSNEFTIFKGDGGYSLFPLIQRRYKDVSFTLLQRAFRRGEIRLNKKRVKAYDKVKEGDIVRVPPAWIPVISPEIIKFAKPCFLHILLQDLPEMFVLNKPAGMATQGGTGITISVDNILPTLWKGEPIFPKLVHRLDKKTSGLLLVAKSPNAARLLTKQFAHQAVQKIYIALVKGLYTGPEYITQPIQYSHNQYKSATTRVLFHAKIGQNTLLCITPLTGRKRQIRIHLMQVGYPIIGEKIGSQYHEEPLLLHALGIVINHMKFYAPLPHYFFDFGVQSSHVKKALNYLCYPLTDR